MGNVIIRKGSIEDVYYIHRLIPEFSGDLGSGFYEERLKLKMHLVLIAEVGGQLAGFKVGYESNEPQMFYSWMGGVIPHFRKAGVARALADKQERWAKKNGFTRIFFKTRNRFPAMINFGMRRGFKIVEVIKKGSEDDYRIVMRKSF